jgi:DNA-binding MarR family transcriptional regulator
LKTNFRDHKNIREDLNRDVEISTSLSSLYKFAKHYTKKVLVDTPLKTMDDFGFMAALMRDGSLSKSELIRENLLELTTGTEIIKRLLKAGLIQEEVDPNDKRSKRVSTTEFGRGMMYGLFAKMGDVAGIVTGHLSEEEKEEILVSFRKLKQFHLLIHSQDKDSQVEIIKEKYW